MDELSEEDKLTVNRARKIQRFLSPAVPRRRGVHRHPRQVRPDRGHGPQSFKAVVDGEYDHLPESAFYMVGGIEEAVAKAEKLAEEA